MIVTFILTIIISINLYSSVQVDGTFNGWEGETIVKLTDGTLWIQSEYNYNYCYSYRPNVTLYQEYGSIKMLIDGCGDEGVAVKQLRFVEKSIKGEFRGWDNETIVQLDDGSFWQQVERYRERCRERNPNVLIYQKGYDYYMIVEGCGDEGVEVKEISNVIKARIVNDFNGFQYGNIYELDNGQKYKQTDNQLVIMVEVMPEVYIFNTGNGDKMMVQGEREVCSVTQYTTSLNINHNNNTSFNQNIYNQNIGNTTLQIINNTQKVVYFSYCFLNGNLWKSVGWFKIDPISSSNITLGFGYTGNIYLYAESDGGSIFWGGDGMSNLICVHPSNEFSYESSDMKNCLNDYKQVSMKEVYLTNSIFQWSLNP